MAADLLEQGAIMQRDKATYASAPHIPGGFITDFNLWRRIAAVAEKYRAQALKITSAERFALVGVQDAVGLGLHLDKKYHGMPLPYKFKIGVAGCPNNCSEASIKDLGLVGAAQGWRVMDWFKQAGKKRRLGKIIEAIGLARFKEELGLPAD